MASYNGNTHMTTLAQNEQESNEDDTKNTKTTGKLKLEAVYKREYAHL